MSWKDRMYAGIGEYLRSTGLDCVRVDSIEEELVAYQGAFDDVEKDFAVWINYEDHERHLRLHRYDGSFFEFLESIK
jgi:hypothetical protein